MGYFAETTSGALVIALYRDDLPQLGPTPFITDGGLETELVFHDGTDLPHFAAFPLIGSEEGRARLRRYFDGYAAIAAEHGLGAVFETPTWRASADWGHLLGYDAGALATANLQAVRLIAETRAAFPGTPVVISGCIGPRGDGYDASDAISADESALYHAPQIGSLTAGGADMIGALTMTSADEAVGIAEAAVSAGIPVAISFTVETDARLPSGQDLGDAVDEVDRRTDGAPVYYMVNCAHPTHLDGALESDAFSSGRVRGLRANASRMSHAELDDSDTLDDGDPAELGRQMADLRSRFAPLTILGGCCGTDARHLAAIAAAVTA